MEIDSRDHLGRMRHIHELIVRTILPFRENTEAAVVMGALIQVARILLRKYPAAIQKDLLEGAVAYLEGKDLDAPTLEERMRKIGIVHPGVKH